MAMSAIALWPSFDTEAPRGGLQAHTSHSMADLKVNLISINKGGDGCTGFHTKDGNVHEASRGELQAHTSLAPYCMLDLKKNRNNKDETSMQVHTSLTLHGMLELKEIEVIKMRLPEESRRHTHH